MAGEAPGKGGAGIASMSLSFDLAARDACEAVWDLVNMGAAPYVTIGMSIFERVCHE